MNRFNRVLRAVSVEVVFAGFGMVLPATAADSDRPTALTFKYTGDDCSVWDNAQSGRASCADYLPVVDEEVSILAFGPETRADIWYEGVVEVGKSFSVDALNAKSFSLTGRTMVIQVSDLRGTLL